mmetsp:Transcript_1292/g.2246  ORF Transcript_1292/g.2246 Transcript_1292/m.2246 type:complete len:320 (-) Transcript_1292:29-988(-)|eukprot:CAMPEP_0194568654 /NCGR_PEP_ID=MMETSP0292-20121207/6693_1 /TAXON_ID=39354 /ORGANISM="Heterosigma akashiwo, Strain CCMP2393" /LENGTH=319 /DNA_ID=CAMNT_0039418767 /DNA_START=130 /DNA_END=1089 /DNA_ORIENTATION=-
MPFFFTNFSFAFFFLAGLCLPDAVDAFASLRDVPSLPLRHVVTKHDAEKSFLRYEIEDEKVPQDLQNEILSAASELWKPDGLPNHDLTHENDGRVIEGESKLKDGILYSGRASHYFHQQALGGCPKAQHSYALLLWSGFGGVVQDPGASARWHAAAAVQNHLDGMAVFGGCLRTGKGVNRNVSLGLKLIDYCASIGNPTGVNKKAALLESNQDEKGAVKLYESCYQSGNANALLLMNLGWCIMNRIGVDRKDVERGVGLWCKAANMAPDEGSEEAAWYLYEEYKYIDPIAARNWLKLAAELGYQDAVNERAELSNFDKT